MAIHRNTHSKKALDEGFEILDANEIDPIEDQVQQRDSMVRGFEFDNERGPGMEPDDSQGFIKRRNTMRDGNHG